MIFSLVCLAFGMDLLSVYDFVTSYTDYLGPTGSLNNVDLPHVSILTYLISQHLKITFVNNSTELNEAVKLIVLCPSFLKSQVLLESSDFLLATKGISFS